MTLIVSWIDKKGAHQCADSRLFFNRTHSDDNLKLINLFEGRILIGIAGSWGINGDAMPTFIKSILPDFSENEIKDKEYYIKKFADTFSGYLERNIHHIEASLEGIRITIVIEVDSEYIIYGIDHRWIEPDGLNSVEKKLRIRPQELFRGNVNFHIARGHVDAEKSFNETYSFLSNSGYSIPETLRHIIETKDYEAIIGGRVFCKHSMSSNYMNQRINEICKVAGLEEYRKYVKSILDFIREKGFEIWISNVGEGQSDSASATNWNNGLVKLNYNDKTTGLDVLWDLLHECGHIIDGMPSKGEEKSLLRELTAWVNGYDKLIEFGLVQHRDSYINRWNFCIKSYYEYNLIK